MLNTLWARKIIIPTTDEELDCEWEKSLSISVLTVFTNEGEYTAKTVTLIVTQYYKGKEA